MIITLPQKQKKSAIKVTQHNYPQTIQLGDIRNIKSKNLPKIDLIFVTHHVKIFQ